jgi:tetratricopeptide (TPR) repeat protein
MMFSMRWILPLTCFVALVGTGLGNPVDWKDSLQAGLVQHYAGHFAEAEVLLRSALEESRRAGRKSETAETLNHLGDVYLSEDRLADAEDVYREAISLYKQSASPATGAIVALRGLGTALSLEGREDRALSTLNDALRRATASFGSDDELIAEILNSLGMAYAQRHDLKKAETLFLEVVRRKSGAGGIDFATANALNNLAQIHRNQRKYADAEREHRQCLEITISLLGSSHPEVGITRGSLGMLYLRMGRLDDAKAQLLDSLRITEQTDPLIPGRMVRVLHILSEVYLRQGNVTESEEALARAAGIARKNPNDPETATVLEAYSAILKRSGKTEQARNTHAEADRVRATATLTAPVRSLSR